MPPVVSVIIVNWNGRHLLRDCLDSLARQTFKDFEVILVDNGSTDDSAAWVYENYIDVCILPLAYNRGFAGGNNQGIGISEGKYIALLNNDSRPWEGWLSELVKAARENPGAGMFASKIISPIGKMDSAGCRLYPDGIGICRGRGEDPGKHLDPVEVDFPSGCAAFYRRAMLNHIGLFDESFFMYCEDVDLGLRAKKAGWKCLYIPKAVVTHLYSQSATSLQKLFYVERNRFKVMANHFSLKEKLVSVPYTLARYFLMTFRGTAWAK